MADSFWLWGDGQTILWGDGQELLIEEEAEDVAPPLTYGGGHDDDYERRVRNWWYEIERLKAQNREREAAEAERKRAIEARRQELAELEAERSRRRAKKAQQARDAALKSIRDDIADMERQSMLLRAENAAVAAEIERIMNEIAAAEQAVLMARRNAALALLLLAS
jgi:chromosome segregation ATPase